MFVRHLLVCSALVGACASQAGAQSARPHNVILFVPDGLRSQMVDARTAPAMNALKTGGVYFANSHAIFPTFTTANASAMATGHGLGDTGDFSNTIYAGFSVPAAAGSVTPFLENDPALGDMNGKFGGNYLDETTILAAARAAGYSTAAVGKVGPVLIFDSTDRTGDPTIVVDDQTGATGGIPLTDPVQAAMKAAGFASLAAPTRGDNGKSGDATTPGTLVPNIAQQKYFADAFTRVVLPQFKARNRPFIAVFWSRDPDGTQHNQGDSLGKLTPGINGPTSLAAIKNADDNLAQILAAVRTLGLSATTDVIVTADHGFSTISKESRTSPAAKITFTGVPSGQLPSGFLAVDLANALSLPTSDPDKDNVVVDTSLGAFPSRGNAVIGFDHSAPDVVVAANGGSDLVYLPQSNARALAGRVVTALLAQDYTSGLFVDDTLGTYPGTLPLSAINLFGTSVTPRPAIVVSFRSYTTGCARPLTCAVEIADTALQQGQGMHGSFNRADTFNFQAATGPDFKHDFVDTAPTSNADVGVTIARLMQLRIVPKGKLLGRPVTEALTGGMMPHVIKQTLRSQAAANARTTELDVQDVGTTRYFDAAGAPGNTLGLRSATIAK